MSFGDTKAKPLIKLCCSPNLWGEPELQVSKSLLKEWRTAGPYHIHMNTHTQSSRDGEFMNAGPKYSSHREGRRGSQKQGDVPSSAFSAVCSQI